MCFKIKNDNKNIHNKSMRKLMIISGWMLCAVAFIVGGFIVVSISGKYNLKKQTISYAAVKENTPEAVMVMSNDRKDLQTDRIRYKELEYNYNNDILTFLFMGIDKERKADALFLFVLNPHEEIIRLIPIDSNTITRITAYDEQGMHENLMTAQIGLQYTFGDGGKESCKYQMQSVSGLFGGISINGYLAIDMDAIPEIIELTDGMDLEIPKPISDDDRLTGQIYLLTEFILRVKHLTGKDITVPVKIYNKISGRVVTDITVDEVVYLTTIAGNYRFNSEQIIMIPGKSIIEKEYPDENCERFYVDEDALNELILNVFYEPMN